MRHWIHGKSAVTAIAALMLAGCAESGAQQSAAADKAADPARPALSQIDRTAAEPAAENPAASSTSPEANSLKQAGGAAAPEPSGDATLASRLLGSRFALAWRPEQQSDGSVTVTVRAADGSRRLAEGATYEAEFSVRDGELRGCAITDPGQQDGVIEADCRVQNGKLILRIGRAHDRGAAMYMELRPVGGNRYEGSVMIRAPMLPVDVRIGNATMQPVLA